MLAFDRDSLICDLAETYHIYDLGSLPLETVAILACGLRDNSRIKMKFSGVSTPTEILLSALAVDRLSLLVWQNSKDGARGRNRPESVAKTLLMVGKPETIMSDSFRTPEEFEQRRKEILERM